MVVKKKYCVLVIAITLCFPWFLFSANLIQNQNNSLSAPINNDDTDESTISEIIEDVPYTSAITNKEIMFTKNLVGAVDIPFNIDIWGSYVHTNTHLGVDFLIELPIDVSVTYDDTYQLGEANDVEIEITCPVDQARLRIQTDIDFYISWDIIGVKKGSAQVIDWTYVFEKYFTTPIGSVNLPFSYTYRYPVVIYGVPVGDICVTATPQIISTIKAELLDNPDFYKSVLLVWEKAGKKTITLAVKPSADPDFSTVVLGEFEFQIAIGIEWKIGFEFTPPFNLINIFLEQMGYPLEWTLGTWPKIDIGAIPSDDTIDLPISIQSDNETGTSFANAIGIDAEDWMSTRTIPLPNPNAGDDWYFTFDVKKDTFYEFEISSCTLVKNVDAYIYDENQDWVADATGSGYPDTLNFVADNDTSYFLVIEPEDITSCFTDVKFTNISRQGVSRGYAKPLSFPYEGDYGLVPGTGEEVWYKFSGNTDDLVSFWCYEFNDTDDIDLYLYYDSEGTARASSATTYFLENFTYVLDDTGNWYLLVDGADIEEGYYWLDYGLSTTGLGYDVDNAISFDPNYAGQSLGPELSTHGGIWLETNCLNDYIYTFAFNGDSDAFYDFILYDNDKNSTLGQGSFTGTAISLNFSCFSDGLRYIHILPYCGGFAYTIDKSSVEIVYVCEDSDNALTIEENFEVKASYPNIWGTDEYWEKIYLTADTKVILKLEFDAGNNYDLYFYKNPYGLDLEASYVNNPEIITYTVDETAWYYILVDRISGTGNFTLTVAQPQPSPIGRIADNYIPEDINEYLSINLKKGQELNINLECSGKRDYYVHLYLYDENLTVLAKDIVGPDLQLTYKVLENGIYYIRIHNSEVGDGIYSGAISVSGDEELTPAINYLGIFILILIPLVIGIVIAFYSYGYKQSNGVYPWQNENVKYKFGRFKRKTAEKLAPVKEKISTKTAKLKAIYGERVKREKESASIIMSEHKVEPETKFRFSTIASKPKIQLEPGELTKAELDALKNAKISDKYKDSEFKDQRL